MRLAQPDTAQRARHRGRHPRKAREHPRRMPIGAQTTPHAAAWVAAPKAQAAVHRPQAQPSLRPPEYLQSRFRPRHSLPSDSLATISTCFFAGIAMKPRRRAARLHSSSDSPTDKHSGWQRSARPSASGVSPLWARPLELQPLPAPGPPARELSLSQLSAWQRAPARWHSPPACRHRKALTYFSAGTAAKPHHPEARSRNWLRNLSDMPSELHFAVHRLAAARKKEQQKRPSPPKPKAPRHVPTRSLPNSLLYIRCFLLPIRPLQLKCNKISQNTLRRYHFRF